MNKYEATEIANKNQTPTHCIWCGNDCTITEVVDVGDAWERWCFCKKCDMQSFHLIQEH